MNKNQIKTELNSLQQKRESDLRKIILYENNPRPNNITQKEFDKMLKLLYAHRRQLETQMKMINREI